MKLTKTKLRQMINEQLQEGLWSDIMQDAEPPQAPSPENVERVKEWAQRSQPFSLDSFVNVGVRGLDDVPGDEKEQIMAILEEEGFIRPCTTCREPEKYWEVGPAAAMEEMIRQITKEVLAEGPPLRVDHPDLGDVARVAGIEQSARGGSFSRPPKLTDEQENMLRDLGYRLGSGGGLHPVDKVNLTAFYETQNKTLPKEIDPGEIIDFLMNYPVFRESYELAGFDERDIEDRS